MALTKYLGIGIAALLTLNAIQCARSDKLNQRVGEAVEQCNTRFAEAREEAEKKIAKVRADAAKEREQALARLREDALASARARAEAEAAREQTERQLDEAMARIEQEDRTWGDTLLPAYLLRD